MQKSQFSTERFLNASLEIVESDSESLKQGVGEVIQLNDPLPQRLHLIGQNEKLLQMAS